MHSESANSPQLLAAVSSQKTAVAFDEAPTTRFHLLVAIAAAGGQFSDGYLLGTIGIALALAGNSLRLNTLWLGLLGGASLAGLFVGSLFVAPLADRVGRRALLARQSLVRVQTDHIASK